eukprot:CAMPEP_0117425640 /NCGR_PEP_ID=MMETSP0758-20121206/5886_1 /TAXON_ID=63605 /ORGANISM="Percolomonas cosmopolitus, Strain AE-1 (ATCC 50343)" /LENGTH=1317 /DNA_ID=CAMNT_0005210275 /DNA_START=80 /DNA_END=4030 /DNA_ORIENTATION=+
MKQNRDFLKTWEEEGKKKHREALKKRRQNKKVELQYEKTMYERKQARKNYKIQRERDELHNSIAQFQKNLERQGKSKPLAAETIREELHKDRKTKKREAKQYIKTIQNKKAKDMVARKDREQRRRKMLLDQAKVFNDIEKTQQQQLLLEKLLKKSKSEQELAAKLAEKRKWKQVIKRNRMFREEQYKARAEANENERLEATKVERETIKQQRKAQAEQLNEKFQETLKQREIKQDKASQQVAHAIFDSVVDRSFATIDYQEQTEGQEPPESLQKTWKQEFIAGQSPTTKQQQPIEETEEETTEKEEPVSELQQLLNEAETQSFLQHTGIWTFEKIPAKEGEEEEEEKPKVEDSVETNPHLATILKSIDQVLNPMPPVGEPELQVTRDVKRLAFLGKPFSGKTHIATQLAETMNFALIQPEQLFKQLIDNTLKSEDEAYVNVMTTLANQAKEELASGKQMSTDVMVNVIFNEIKRIEQSTDQPGWILDGFPNTIETTQALEAKLSGYQDSTHQPTTSEFIVNQAKQDSLERHPYQSFHAVIVLNVDNTIVFQRATEQSVDPSTNTLYHLTYNPPPEEVLSRLQPVDESTNMNLAKLNVEVMQSNTTISAIQQFYEQPALARPCQHFDANDNLDEVKEAIHAFISKLPANLPPTSKVEEEEEQSEEQGEEEEQGENEEQGDEEQPPVKEEETIKDNENKSAQLFADIWYTFETEFKNKLNQTFFSMRKTRSVFLELLNNMKQEFLNFMRQPEQEAENQLAEFQQYYNAIDVDLRREKTQQQEAHHRLETLRESLWRRLEERKKNAVTKKTSIVSDQSIPKNDVYVTRIFMQLVQYATMRFLHSIKFYRDYYLEQADFPVEVEPSTFESLYAMVVGDDPNDKKKKKAPPKKKKGEEDTFESPIDVDFEACLERARATLTINLADLAEGGGKKKGGNKKKVVEEVREQPASIDEALSIERHLFERQLLTIQHAFEQTKKEISGQTTTLFDTFDKWIERRFEQEFAALESIVASIHASIDTLQPIPEELRLEGDRFGRDEYVIMLEQDPHEGALEENPVATYRERSSLDLTLSQTLHLVERFRMMAPTAFIRSEQFVMLILSLSDSSFGSMDLPESWMNLTKEELTMMTSRFPHHQVNWQEFLFDVLMQCFPCPSNEQQQEMTVAFGSASEQSPDGLNEEQFLKLPLWFESSSSTHVSMTNEDLKKALFNIFKNDSNLVNPTTFLLHLSLDRHVMKSLKKCFITLSTLSNSAPLSVKRDQLYDILHFGFNPAFFAYDSLEDIFSKDQINLLFASLHLKEDESVTFDHFVASVIGRYFIQHVP